MKVLVTGGGGQVGRAVAHMAPAAHDAIVIPHAELDIGHAAAVTEALQASGAEWIVNAAAYTAVDRAEVRA